MWVEMVRQYADAERSLAPGQRGMFSNEDAQKMIDDGAAFEVDGPHGERTERAEVRTRPVPQPPRARRATKKDGQGDGDGTGGQASPKDPAEPKGPADPAPPKK